jgi:hypothetical protein
MKINLNTGLFCSELYQELFNILENQVTDDITIADNNSPACVLTLGWSSSLVTLVKVKRAVLYKIFL